MKSFLNTAGAAIALLVASTGSALAVDFLPEPGSLALVGLGLGAAVFFLRKKK